MAAVHKARPVSPHNRVTQHCAVCNEWIKPLPGGQGPTWVHTATGAVAAPGADPADPTVVAARERVGEFIRQYEIQHSRGRASDIIHSVHFDPESDTGGDLTFADLKTLLEA